MSAASTPYPQFSIDTIAGAPVTATPFTVFSSVLAAGKYRVDGVINGLSSAGVGSTYSVSAALISASPLISLSLGLPDDYSSVDAPISFCYISNGITPLVITLTATFASGTFATAARAIRFNRTL